MLFLYSFRLCTEHLLQRNNKIAAHKTVSFIDLASVTSYLRMDMFYLFKQFSFFDICVKDQGI